MTQQYNHETGNIAPVNFEYYRPVFDDLHRLERHQVIIDILSSIEKALPPTYQSYDLVCYGYYKAKQYLSAVKWGEKALAAATDPSALGSIRFNLSKCYSYANFPEKAERCLKLNTKYNPSDMSSAIDYSVAIYGTGRKDEAEVILRKALAHGNFANPKDEVIINFNLGTHELRHSNFKQGMKQLAIGRKLHTWGSHTHNFPIPEWGGMTRAGSKILIVGEGGIGDEIVNARFVKHIRDRGMLPYWSSAHGLKDIFARLPFEGTQNYTNYTSDIANIRDFDYWTPGMNLPMTLEVDSDELWYGRYLSISDQHKQKWDWIKQSPKIKIGLRWSGNPLYEQDLHRSIPLDKIHAMLTNNPNVELYSLQKGPGSEQTAMYPDVIDLQDKLDTFEDALAVIDNMDYVISSCTSIAHAAAALDKKTFVLIPIMSYYLWAEERPHCSWYSDNLTLLRQDKPRDWSVPLQQLKQHISQF